MKWKGYTDLREDAINENLSTFLSLALGVLIIIIALLLPEWFMFKPRVQQLNPTLKMYAGWAIVGFATCLCNLCTS